MGHHQDTLCGWLSASGRHLGRRICLRKGCDRTYQARRWNQRYCQAPECLKLVRRWLAAKRQAERRRRSEVRQAHAAVECQRRARCRAEGRQGTPRACNSTSDEDPAPDPRAWSRSRDYSAPFCDRPGCYEAVRASFRCQARYCSNACRQAVRRVRDRERKWLARNTQVGRFKRSIEYQVRRRARGARSP